MVFVWRRAIHVPTSTPVTNITPLLRRERQQSEIDRLRIERAHYDALLRQHGDKLDEAFRKTLEATLHAADRRYVEGRHRGITVWRWSRSMTVARNYLMVLNYSIDDLKERLLRYYPEGPPPPRYYAGCGGDG